jgi:hypothetical protein
VNPTALGKIIERAMSGHLATQQAMADHLGITQGHLSKLKRGRVERINHSTWGKLWQINTMRGREALARAVVLPETREVLDRYTRWLARELDRFDLAGEALNDNPFERYPWPRSNPEGWRLYQSCARIYADLTPYHDGTLVPFIRWLWRTHPSGRNKDAVTATRQTIVKARFSTLDDALRVLNARATLAVLRILEPFAADAVGLTGGVEVAWHELDAAKRPNVLTRYLAGSIARERALLERKSDAQRAADLGHKLTGGMDYSEFARTIRRAGLGDFPPMDEGD